MRNISSLNFEKMAVIKGDGWLDIANGFCTGLTIGGGLTAGAAYLGIVTVTVSATGGAALGVLALGCGALAIYDFYE